jgi:hypothetical protein
MSRPPQSNENHVRLDPLYHFVSSPALLLSTVLALVLGVILLRQGFNVQNVLMTLWMLTTSLGAFAGLFFARIYALRVQDRVIALECERRYERLGGRANSPLIEKLEPGQLVGLRFASDAEFVALADRAAAEKLRSRDIKKAIKQWRGDYRRI